MTRRLVDPIHLFNSCGLSAFSEAEYERIIAELRAENARLTRALEAAKRRLGWAPDTE
jgi:hypothetical protein